MNYNIFPDMPRAGDNSLWDVSDFAKIYQCGDETYDPDYDMINSVRSWGVGAMASGINLIVSAGGTLIGKFGGAFAGKSYEHYMETKVDNFVNDMNNRNLSDESIAREGYLSGYESTPQLLMMGSMLTGMSGLAGAAAGGTGAAGGALSISLWGGEADLTGALTVGITAEVVGSVVLTGTGVAGLVLFGSDGNGSGTNGKANSILKWGNSKSKPTYGHTFTEHGQKQTPTQLIDRARSLDHQVGQWLDDQKTADFLTEIARNGEGVYDVKLPPSVRGRSFLPDGTQIEADMARVIVKTDGSIRTAFPYNGLFN